MMDANILNIATTGKPTVQWMKAAEEVADKTKSAQSAFNLVNNKYSYTLGSGLGGTVAQDVTGDEDDDEEVSDEGEDIDDLFDDIDDDTVEGDEEVVEIIEEVVKTPPAPTPKSRDDLPVLNAAKIKDSVKYDADRFVDIVPPTEEEEISLSGKEWEVVQENLEGYYPYNGVLYIDFTPATDESQWQPFKSIIDSIADEGDLDDLFGGDDDDSTTEDELLDETPYFTTPDVTFAFQAGMKTVFHIDGDTSQMWYAASGDLAGKGNTNHFLVDSIELKWAEPKAGVTDKVVGCRIVGHNSSAASDTHTIIIEDGVIQLTDGGNVNDGLHYNINRDTSNMYGGNLKPIANNTALVYGHGVRGFKGLPDATNAPNKEDTMVWSDFKDNGNVYTGTVQIDGDKSIAQVIQTQIARFYGKDSLTDKNAYWNNWLPGGSGTMKPIFGGGNVIMYFDPKVTVHADIRDYVDTEYLRPKRKKLDIIVEEGEIPTETDITGIITFTPVLDEDGDVEDEIWNAYVEFNVIPISGGSTDYFTGKDTGAKNESNSEKIMLPGDESKLRFRVPPYGETDIINQTADGLARANSITYITYDKSTVEYLQVDDEGNPLPDSSILVPQVKVFFNDNTSMVIPDEEGEFKALDFNNELIEGEVEGAELKPPQPKIVIKFGDNTISYGQLETLRRNKNLSPRFTKRNKEGQVTTQDIAIKIGSKYFIIGTVKGKSVLLMVDLNLD